MISFDHPEILEEGIVFAFETTGPPRTAGRRLASRKNWSSLRRGARSSPSSPPRSCWLRESVTTVPAAC
jgi:hypothetical protein